MQSIQSPRDWLQSALASGTVGINDCARLASASELWLYLVASALTSSRVRLSSVPRFAARPPAGERWRGYVAARRCSFESTSRSTARKHHHRDRSDRPLHVAPARLGLPAGDDELGLERRRHPVPLRIPGEQPPFGLAQIGATEEQAAVGVALLPFLGADEQPRVTAKPVEVQVHRGDERVDLCVEVAGLQKSEPVQPCHRRMHRLGFRFSGDDGMMRLFCLTAWSISSPQTGEATESGLMTKTKACAASIAERIFAIHSSVG